MKLLRLFAIFSCLSPAFAQELLESESASRAPASQAPSPGQYEYIVELTGHKNAIQYENVKEKIRALLPQGSVSYEKSLRRGQAKLYVRTSVGRDDLIAQLNGITVQQKNSILSTHAEWADGVAQEIKMRIGQ
jgi:hypothetical protein